eukprot:TRINITY_DN13827_c0_g1_i2.p1 TRINITY_DN13827_c0_g1~~TRINITY_DN13827_c0_g1_i2.p1  ORF type:complete len:373 (+),score=76.05 TRINITY_DN13827_c0_g1_i2:132-1250(+)
MCIRDRYQRRVRGQQRARMSRKVELTGIPESRRDGILEALAGCEPVAYVDVIPARRCLSDPSTEQMSDEECYLIHFKVRMSHVSRVLKLLKTRGVGEEFGAIDVYPIQFSTQQDRGNSRNMREDTGRESCCPSASARMPTLEIHNNIVGSSHLNFDHIMCVATASGIAGVGLLTDSSPFILASFFISPLMGMIMAVTWGAVIRDGEIIKRGLRNMIWGILICIASGCVLGMLLSMSPDEVALKLPLTSPLKSKQSGIYSSISINTAQILSRGPPVGNVVSSFIVAVLSGVAIALGQSSGISSALAGCAMSTSLLPPLVEIGLMFGLYPAYGNLITANGDTIMTVAGYSMSLYTVNVVSVLSLIHISEPTRPY